MILARYYLALGEFNFKGNRLNDSIQNYEEGY